MDEYIILSEIFPNKSQEVIENIIRIVEENREVGFSYDEKLETMINLLSESVTFPENMANDNLPDEAAGFGDNNIQDAVSVTLQDMFPDADPGYLEMSATELACDTVKLDNFIDKHLENKNYPKLEDYLRKKNEQSEMDKYLSQFSLFLFLLEYPDPITSFNDTNRKHSLSNFDEEKNDTEQKFALTCLCNQFPFIKENTIKKMFQLCKRDIIKSYNRLMKLPREFRTARCTIALPDISINNTMLLHEIAFIQHEKEIRNMMIEKERNVEEARKLGLLQTCNCCCKDDVIPEDCFPCKDGCISCRECIRRAAEIAYADGKSKILCLSNCGDEYSLSTLQMVLNPKTFSNLCHTIQMQEVNAAAIDGLEYCPLCSNWAMIPNPQDLIFHCDGCNKDSCRKCKHVAHVPKRCNEIEYDEDVKMRTHIENRMTEELLRKCYKCGQTFIKNSGCNKITCSCGAKMCYICRAPVTDYSHFQETGCPLHTNDEEIHLQNVRTGANIAKAELGIDKNPEILKFDPAKNL